MKRLPIALVLCAASVAGCHRVGPPTLSSFPIPVQAAGLHNVFRLTDKLLSGSSPDDEEGFRSLHELGVRTIISVDGARPDIDLAHKHGLRYVHLPIGYDGVPSEQGLRIARAVRDLPGLVYIHCHHGKHRGPSAAAVARLCLDESCPAETAISWLRQAGTDPHYTGLYKTVEHFHRPTPGELDQVPADFPEVAPIPALAELMVSIDQTWDRLKKVRSAAWKAPADHADLDPPHEALQLMEHFREAGRLPVVTKQPEEFQRWMGQAERAAQQLETALREKESEAAAKAFDQIGKGCTQCHMKYRDVPKDR